MRRRCTCGSYKICALTEVSKAILVFFVAVALFSVAPVAGQTCQYCAMCPRFCIMTLLFKT